MYVTVKANTAKQSMHLPTDPLDKVRRGTMRYCIWLQGDKLFSDPSIVSNRRTLERCGLSVNRCDIDSCPSIDCRGDRWRHRLREGRMSEAH
jgi:hypothetical protein